VSPRNAIYSVATPVTAVDADLDGLSRVKPMDVGTLEKPFGVSFIGTEA
jgi:hypothetical protein